jgi:hypothetical protein
MQKEWSKIRTTSSSSRVSSQSTTNTTIVSNQIQNHKNSSVDTITHSTSLTPIIPITVSNIGSTNSNFVISKNILISFYTAKQEVSDSSKFLDLTSKNFTTGKTVTDINPTIAFKPPKRTLTGKNKVTNSEEKIKNVIEANANPSVVIQENGISKANIINTNTSSNNGSMVPSNDESSHKVDNFVPIIDSVKSRGKRGNSDKIVGIIGTEDMKGNTLIQSEQTEPPIISNKEDDKPPLPLFEKYIDIPSTLVGLLLARRPEIAGRPVNPASQKNVLNQIQSLTRTYISRISGPRIYVKPTVTTTVSDEDKIQSASATGNEESHIDIEKHQVIDPILVPDTEITPTALILDDRKQGRRRRAIDDEEEEDDDVEEEDETDEDEEGEDVADTNNKIQSSSIQTSEEEEEVVVVNQLASQLTTLDMSTESNKEGKTVLSHSTKS